MLPGAGVRDRDSKRLGQVARSRKSKGKSAPETAPTEKVEADGIEDAVVADGADGSAKEAGTPDDAGEAIAEDVIAGGDEAKDTAEADGEPAETQDAAESAEAGSEAGEGDPAGNGEASEETDEAAESAPDEVSAELDPEPAPEPEPEPEPEPVPAPPPARVEVQRVGLFPVLIGGAVAAFFGAAALYIASERGWAGLGGGDTEALVAEIEGLKAEIGGLQDEIAALRDGVPDIAPVADAVAGLQAGQEALSAGAASLSEAVDGLSARIDATDTRVAEVETQPIPMAQLPEEIRNAYDRQVAAMEAQVGERFAEVQAALDAKLAEIEAARAAASDQEVQAMAAARAAEARAALAEIEVALDTGSGYAQALAALNDSADVSADAALTDHANEGVPSLAALQDSFPDAARAALADATRAAADSGDVNPVTAFLRTQLGARSLEPREGDDPDAVLSRAEAALGGGDLETTLTEIAALPEAGQAALSAWVGDAETRRAALNALADLAAQLDSN